MSNQKSERESESERQPTVPPNLCFPDSIDKERQQQRPHPVQLDLLEDDQLDLFDSAG